MNGPGGESRVPRTARPRRNTRPRDELGRPLPYGSAGAEQQPEAVVRGPRESLVEADRLLRAGRPFHAHEVLEDAWKSQPSTEAELWRGLAQLAVGITHAARGNAAGAVRLIERGTANVASYRGVQPHGVDVESIIDWAARAVVQVNAGVPAELEPPPLVPADSGDKFHASVDDVRGDRPERASESRRGGDRPR